jgi:hypothetical protein
VLQQLREKDNDHIKRTNIRRFFVCKGYEEIADFLHRWPRTSSYNRFYTGDMSNMYTNIPHDSLITAITSTLNEVWAWMALSLNIPEDRLAISHSKHGCSWRRARRSTFSDTNKVLLKDTLVEWLTFLIRNSYILNGDTLRRQSIGIPQGTPCGGELANILLYHYESSFIDRLITNGQLTRASCFHMTFRYIDDIFSVDNPFWIEAISVPAELGGIYPIAVTLNDTTISDREVYFMGMHITSSACARITMDIYDKRKDFPFKVVRYPDLRSLIPESLPYGVFTSQLVRYSRICTSSAKFIYRSRLLAQQLLSHLCTPRKLRRFFNRFISTRHLRWDLRTTLI